MSATAFLRSHGWRLGRDLWWHDRLPDAGHHIAVALLQQAQWLEWDLVDAKRALAILQDKYVSAAAAAEKEIT